MKRHNSNVYMDHVPLKNCENQILLTVDKKYKISNSEVILNMNDIRKIEMVAITELKFGRLAKYKDSVMNVVGGGEAVSNDKEILYFRLGKKSETLVPEKEKGSVEYYSGIIPKSKGGLIDWSALIPSWKIVLECGSKLKRKKVTDWVCVCGKKFNRKDSLDRHKKICEAAGGKQTTVVCGICGKILSERYLPDHMRLVHGNKNPSRGSKSLAKRGNY